jgi:hypothetical protein
MPLTYEQFQELDAQGFSPEEIADFEKRRISETPTIEKKPPSGIEKQNILGQIFNVPGAAIRSGLMGKGYAQGAMNPSQVPTFQNALLDTYYKKTPNFPGKTVLGNIPSAIGLGADIATNPADLLPMVAGMSPTVQKMGKAIGATSPAKSFNQWLNKERQMPLPKVMNQKWLTDKAKTVKDVVDDTVSGLKEQYKVIFENVNDKEVTKLGAIPKNYLEEFGLGNKATIKQLWETRTKLLEDIAESTWDKPNYYSKIRPNQKEMRSVVDTIKNIVQNNVDDQTREALYKIDPQFETAIKKGRKLVRMVYDSKSDTYKFKGLAETFKDPESIGSRQAFNEFKQFSTKLNQVEKDMNKYISRQKIKTHLKRLGGVGLGLYMAHRYATDKLLSK